MLHQIVVHISGQFCTLVLQVVKANLKSKLSAAFVESFVESLRKDGIPHLAFLPDPLTYSILTLSSLTAVK